MEVKEVKTINNMKNFTDLFLSLYFIEETDEHSKVVFSKYFEELFDEIINLSRYKKVLDKSLYDENGKFKIDEFLKSATVTRAKMYIKDDYNYDLLNDVIFTEINKQKCYDTTCDYSIKDNITVSYILMDYINLQSYLLDNKDEIDVVNYKNSKIEELAQLFLAKYSIYINSINETDKVVFSKYFREILSKVINENKYAKEFFENAGFKFNIEEFLYYIGLSRIKKYWMDSWGFNISKSNMYTSINIEVAKLFEKYNNPYINNIVSSIISDYIQIENSIKEDSKNLQLLFKSDD